MPFIETDKPHYCRHGDHEVTAWYAQPSGDVIFSGKCRACYTANRKARAASKKIEAEATDRANMLKALGA